MSYKKILVSDNGKLKESNLFVNNNTLSSSAIINVNSASIANLNGLLVEQDNTITSITGSANNQAIQFKNGSVGIVSVPNSSTINVGGDLKFNNGNILVDNISNINSGSLGTQFGGTAKGASLPTGSLISGENISIIQNNVAKVVSINSLGNLILSNLSDLYTYMSPVQIYLYTGTNVWTKPANCRMIRVMCQAAGGGGGAGTNAYNVIRNGGGGGGGGGFSDAIFNADTISTVQITVGGGGSAGARSSSSPTGGGTGGVSSFGTILSANGGFGGSTGGGGGAGGTGFSKSGGGGGGVGIYDAGFGKSITTGIAGCGGGLGGYNTTSGGNQMTGWAGGGMTEHGVAGGSGGSVNGAGGGGWSQRDYYHKGSSTGYSVVRQNGYTNGATLSLLPQVLASGAGGGGGRAGGSLATAAADGGWGGYGGGGGGGGANNNSRGSSTGGNGGGGGGGYVMIICF